jgi:hypothetical protein
MALARRAVTTQEATLPRNTSPCMAAAGAPAFSNAAAEPPHRCEHGQALNMLLSTFLGRSSEQPSVPETASRREVTSGRPIETLEKRLRLAAL